MNELAVENENGTPPPIKSKKGKKVMIADDGEEEFASKKKKKQAKPKAPSTSQNEVLVYLLNY